jgi:DNA-binding cell septation regulator SpoVG
MEQWNCLLKRKDHQSTRMRPDEFLLTHYKVIKGRQVLFIDNLSKKQKKGLMVNSNYAVYIYM